MCAEQKLLMGMDAKNFLLTSASKSSILYAIAKQINKARSEGNMLTPPISENGRLVRGRMEESASHPGVQPKRVGVV